MKTALALSVLLGGTALADAPHDTPAALEVDREDAPPGETAHGFDSGEPVHGWAATVAVGLLARPIALSAPDPSYPVARRTTLSLGGAFAVTSSIVLDARLPMATQTGARLAALGDDRPLQRHVLGDLRLGARIEVIPGILVRAEVSIPTGNAAQLAGDASWSAGWSLIGRLVLPRAITLVAAAGLRLRATEVLVVDRLIGNEVVGAAGALVPLTSHVALGGELAGALGDHIARKQGISPVELRGGLVVHPMADLAVGVRAGVGLDDEIGAPAWRITFTTTYAR